MPEWQSLSRYRRPSPVPLSNRSWRQLLRDWDRCLDLCPLCLWCHLPFSRQWCYVCECRHSYQGLNCEYIDKCASLLCMNGGTCHGFVNNFVFLSTWNSRNAVRVELERVSFEPASERGTWVDGINALESRCIAGFAGPPCEGQANPCSKDGMLRCDLRVNGFRCVCQRDRICQLCDIHLESCPTNVCLNGGNCVCNNEGNLCAYVSRWECNSIPYPYFNCTW